MASARGVDDMDGSLHYANKPERCDDGEFQYDSVSLNLSSINSAQQSPSARGAGRTTSSPAASSYEFPDSAGGVYTPPTSSRAPLPHAASHITKARRIRLYRNADAFYDGMIVLVTPENYRTFDSLLAYINRTPLADPSKLKKVSPTHSTPILHVPPFSLGFSAGCRRRRRYCDEFVAMYVCVWQCGYVQ